MSSKSENDLYPDFFLLSLSELVSLKDSSLRSSPGLRFGVPVANCACLVDVVFEGKVGSQRLHQGDLGQLLEYLYAMQNGSLNPESTLRGIVYNSHHFIFVRIGPERQKIKEMISSRWDVPGARELLLEKINTADRNGIVRALVELKQEGYEIQHVLGRGRFGIVFHMLHTTTGAIYALKIVSPSTVDFELEYKKLCRCGEIIPHLVVSVVPDSYRVLGY